jgi:hypothetical protein
MICPKCNHQQPDGHSECFGCGVIFAKVRAFDPLEKEDTSASGASVAVDVREPSGWKHLLLPLPEDVNQATLVLKGLLWLALAVWAFKFIFASVASNYAGESILHLVNLPFHEAGHLIFIPFGRFLSVLGGSLMQLIVPAVCASVLLLRTRDAFGASVALWWLAQNFMDIAPYINDARALDLVLLGGFTGKDVADYHDWEYILGKLGLLRFDHVIANLAQFTGILLMITALVWGGVILKQSLSFAKTKA